MRIIGRLARRCTLLEVIAVPWAGTKHADSYSVPGPVQPPRLRLCSQSASGLQTNVLNLRRSHAFKSVLLVHSDIWAYSKRGRARIASLLAPWSTILSSLRLNSPTGIATRHVPIPRKPPTPRMTCDTARFARTRSSILPDELTLVGVNLLAKHVPPCTESVDHCPLGNRLFCLSNVSQRHTCAQERETRHTTLPRRIACTMSAVRVQAKLPWTL